MSTTSCHHFRRGGVPPSPSPPPLAAPRSLGCLAHAGVHPPVLAARSGLWPCLGLWGRGWVMPTCFVGRTEHSRYGFG